MTVLNTIDWQDNVENKSYLTLFNDLLADEDIGEIMINRYDRIFVEKHGVLHQWPVSLDSRESLDMLTRHILELCNATNNIASQAIDGMLPDGSRVSVVLPPASVEGPSISVRKKSKSLMSFDEMVRREILPQNVANFLIALAKVRVSIMISGSTSSGKTTLLNALSFYIHPNERIITIEDTAELDIQHENVVRLESNGEKNGMSQRDLLKSALRLRGDRIIMGELRGDEALDFMQAINTGHDGSMSTIHANNPRDAFNRLEMMISLSGTSLTPRFIQQQISSSLNIIVQVKRGADGRRYITNISEIMGREGDMVILNELFVLVVDPKTGKNIYQWNNYSSRNAKIQEAITEAKLNRK